MDTNCSSGLLLKQINISVVKYSIQLTQREAQTNFLYFHTFQQK